MVWLGRVERRLDSRRGGAWRGMVAPLFVCQPRWDLSTPSALVHARANVCRYIYVYIYIQAVYALHLTNITSMYSMEEEEEEEGARQIRG